MKDYNNILMSKMRDIQGLEDISAWPFAIGWWLIIFLFSCAAFVIIRKILSVKKYKKSWRYRLESELDTIAHDDNTAMAKQNISRLNEILKRIAIQLYGRKESAGLNGKKWLVFLTNRDPGNFNWIKRGEILINYPYMPEEKIQANMKEISAIAKAIKPWLKL